MDLIEPLAPLTQADADALLAHLQAGEGRGSTASVTHLKAALYDWRVEQQWDKPGSAALQLDGEGVMFITFTSRAPRHCTLRHFFVLEEARGKGVGVRMMKLLEKLCIHHRVRYLRFFANKPAIQFYERCGYSWHGTSKTDLPFTYWDLAMGRLAPLPRSQVRYLRKRTMMSLTLDRRIRQ